MSIIHRSAVSRHDAFDNALETLSLDRHATPFLLMLKRVPPLFVVITVALILAGFSTYLFFQAGSASKPAGINDKIKLAKAALAAGIINENAGSNITANWSELEPAYKSYKLQVGNDNSLQSDQRAIELYGVNILPRSQICSYQSGERWACGQRAFIALLNVLGADTVDCRPQQTDQPRVVVCRIAGSDIAELMLREGWGSLPHGVTEQSYIDAAAAASTNKVGMWSPQPPKR